MKCIIFVLVVILFSSCAQPSKDLEICNKRSAKDKVVIGKIQIDHGDYLILQNAESLEERIFLIRDRKLQENILQLDGKTVTLVVERVSACDKSNGSNLAACLWLGEEGVAYKINDWCGN